MLARTRASVPRWSAETRGDGGSRRAVDPTGGTKAHGLAGAVRAARRVRPRQHRPLGGGEDLYGGRVHKTRPDRQRPSAGFAIHSTQRIGDQQGPAPGFIVSEVDPR